MKVTLIDTTVKLVSVLCCLKVMEANRLNLRSRFLSRLYFAHLALSNRWFSSWFTLDVRHQALPVDSQ